MALLKVSLVALAMVAAASAGLLGPPPNTYLPPVTGYDYKKPTTTPSTVTQPPTGHEHHEPGMPFDFNYAVKDDEFGVDQKHNAVSDGDVVRGEYRVLLPDGRTQVVTYTADWKNGYNAEVTYEGTARPEPPTPPKRGY